MSLLFMSVGAYEDDMLQSLHQSFKKGRERPYLHSTYAPDAKPDLSSAQTIYKIARGARAEQWGLRPGDSLIRFNGQPVPTNLIDALLACKKNAHYVFYQPRDHCFLDVETDTMPLGLSMLPNSKMIINTYKSQGCFGDSGFLALWEREDYASLKLAIDAAGKKSRVCSFFQKLRRKDTVLPTVQVLGNIATFELGQGTEGLAELLHQDKFEKFSPRLQGLLHVYKARLAQIDDDLSLYEACISAAQKLYPDSERIKSLAISAGLPIEDCDKMLSKIIPLHYKFEYLFGGKGGVDMKEILGAMPPHKIMPVCFLPAGQNDDIYDQALKAYRCIYPHFKDNLHPLLVITNQKHGAQQFYGQEKTKGHGKIPMNAPVTIVCEPSGNFIKDLMLNNAPILWAIDKSGRVIWDKGLMDDYDYLEML